MITTTLGEWGAKLPIGFANGKTFDRDLVLRPFKARQERALGEWRLVNMDKYDGSQLVAMHTAKLLSLLIEKAGPHTFAPDPTGDSTPASELSIHKWTFADVMYSYIYARVKSLGPEMEVNAACKSPGCKFTGKIRFDLNTLDMRAAESPEELFHWVDLKRPFLLRDGSTRCRSVRLRPIQWSTMTRSGALRDTVSGLQLSTTLDMVSAVNRTEEPYQLTEAEMDGMERIDQIRIDRISDKIGAGADMSSSIPCPKCNTPITDALQWSYDYFFGLSLPLDISTT